MTSQERVEAFIALCARLAAQLTELNALKEKLRQAEAASPSTELAKIKTRRGEDGPSAP